MSCMLSHCVMEYVVDVKACVARQEWHLLKSVDVDAVLEHWEKTRWVWPDGASDPRTDGGVEQPYVMDVSECYAGG